ncbi:MAG: GDP-mannose pyrophosphatase NudK [Flavobacteriaceae bacterium]|nr:GDP-mannose pyrophosphatase NudK [Flavobacteriaceae bacterium]
MNQKVKNLKIDLLSNNWYTLNNIHFDYQLKNGEWVSLSRESYDRGNGATILLYNTKKKTIILIQQFRMPSFVNGNDNGMMIETCAGVLDGDDPITCIVKETEEETGYRIKKVEKVFESYMSPGAVTEIIHFFIAEYDDDMKLSEGGGLASENEDIDVLEIDFNKAIQMVKSGEIKDAKTIMLLQYAQINKLIS